MNIEKISEGVSIYQPEKWNRNTKIKGLLFDMDGLILDTEKLYTRFWQEAANALGYPMTKEQALVLCLSGRGDKDAHTIESYFSGKGYLN